MPMMTPDGEQAEGLHRGVREHHIAPDQVERAGAAYRLVGDKLRRRPRVAAEVAHVLARHETCAWHGKCLHWEGVGGAPHRARRETERGPPSPTPCPIAFWQRTVATRIGDALGNALERQRADVRFARVVKFVVLLLVQDIVLTVGHVKAVQDVQLIVQGRRAAKAEGGGHDAGSIAMRERLAYSGAARTRKRARPTARSPQSAGSLS